MSKTRPPYSPEFRRQMVDLVRAGRDPEELAREFEPTSQSIRNWVGQAGLREGRREERGDALGEATDIGADAAVGGGGEDMGVVVDQPRQDQAAGGVDLDGRAGSVGLDDAPAGGGDVPDGMNLAGGVDDGSVANEKIGGHGSLQR